MSDPRFCERCGTPLAPPRDHLRPACPACGWFRPTNALPVALVLAVAPSGRILYTRQPGWPDGAWGLVAGFVEEGETAEDAALREVREETGLEARRPHVLRTLTRAEDLLVCVEVDIDDAEPRAGSDVSEVALALPDPDLTPPGWQARTLVDDLIARRRSP